MADNQETKQLELHTYVVEAFVPIEVRAQDAAAAVAIARTVPMEPGEEMHYRVWHEDCERAQRDVLEMLRNDYIESLNSCQRKFEQTQLIPERMAWSQKIDGIMKRLRLIDTALGRL